MSVRASLVIASLTLACGPSVAVDDPTTTTTTTSGDTRSSGSDEIGDPSTMGTTTGTTTDADTSTTSTTSADESSNPFILPVDQGSIVECDVWIDDCPVGEKCMPWANDATFSHTRCVPIAEDANAVGEPCTVEGSGMSGFDDCEKHAMCWDVDPETNTGTCFAMCDGSQASPSCSEACTHCDVMFDGLVNLCIPHCDPLLQDCDDGWGCKADDHEFECAPEVPTEIGIGDPCDFIYQCPIGLACVSAPRVPGCGADGQCCTPLCDASTDTTCDDLIPGSTCVAWDGVPPCFPSAVGACEYPR